MASMLPMRPRWPHSTRDATIEKRGLRRRARSSQPVLFQQVAQLVIAEPEVAGGAALVMAVGVERGLDQAAFEACEFRAQIERLRPVGNA